MGKFPTFDELSVTQSLIIKCRIEIEIDKILPVPPGKEIRKLNWHTAKRGCQSMLICSMKNLSCAQDAKNSFSLSTVVLREKVYSFHAFSGSIYIKFLVAPLLLIYFRNIYFYILSALEIGSRKHRQSKSCFCKLYLV